MKWIRALISFGDVESLPLRERGLKSAKLAYGISRNVVAPFTGAWIEIKLPSKIFPVSDVAPFTGAWIEILEEVTEIKHAHSRSLYGSVD